MKKRRIAAAAALTFAAACSNQMPSGATFRLVSASNNPLPILLQIDECEHFLHGGIVQFDGRGGYKSTYDIRKVCGDRTLPANDPGTVGRFEIRNDTAFFRDAGGRAAGIGVLSRDSLIVKGPLHRLVYLRQH